MRITNSMIVSTTLENISANARRLEDLQNKISSGKRVRRPADDPVAVARVLGLKTELRQIEQYQRNIEGAKAWLQVTESALGGVSAVVQRARELAVSGATETLTASERAAIAAEVSQLFASALQLGNTRYASQYVFAGFKISTPPFQAAANPQGYAYQGDGGAIRREIEVNATIVVNTSGQEVFPQVLQGVKALLDGLNASNTAQIQSSIGLLDSGLEAVLAEEAEVGAKVNRLAAADERLQDIGVNVLSVLSSTEDLDMAKGLMDFSAQQNVYQASLKAGAYAVQPSLLDYLS